MKTKVLTRTILLVSFVSLFTDIASEMLYPVMPVYLKSIGFSVLLIGILEGLAEATAGISKGYFGNLSDKVGKRLPFVQWGYFLSAISKPLMAVFVYPLWIFFARTLDRLGKGVRTSARDAMLSDESLKENKGRVFGFHRAMDTVGAAIGPFIALIYLYFFPGNYYWLFIIAFIPGLFAILFTLFIKEKKKEDSPKKKKVNFFTYLSYWKRSSVAYKRLIVGLLIFTLFNSSDAFLLLTLKNQGLSDLYMIGCYIFYNLVYALFAFPMGYLGDKIGLKRIMIIGLALFSVVYYFMGFAFTLVHFIILFLLYGIYAASTEGVSKALISNIVKKEEMATSIGFYNSFVSVFALLASSLAGLIWFAFGQKTMFVISGIGVSLVVIYLSIIKINASEND